MPKKWDRLKAIKKANRSKLHDFYYLRHKSISNGLKQCMLTFTYKDDDKYFKMDIINDIKNYVTKQLRNHGIKYYANIEVGSDFSNPHLHIQVYYQYDQYNKISSIKDNTIAKYGLFSEYCVTSMPNKENVLYDYVVKDYKIKDDNELLLMDDVKRDYRAKLHKNIRFSSFSKEKYSKAIYKKAYGCGILKCDVDYLIDDCIINKDIELIDYRVIYYFRLLFLSYLVQYIEQVIYKHILENEIKKATYLNQNKIDFSIYGFI